MCYSAILSVHSVWLSCNSRAGRAEGILSKETGEGGWLDEMGGFYWAPAVTAFWMGSKWHRLAIVLYYDITIHDMSVMDYRL
jgi:hypothetical protein